MHWINVGNDVLAPIDPHSRRMSVATPGVLVFTWILRGEDARHVFGRHHDCVRSSGVHADGQARARVFIAPRHVLADSAYFVGLHAEQRRCSPHTHVWLHIPDDGSLDDPWFVQQIIPIGQPPIPRQRKTEIAQRNCRTTKDRNCTTKLQDKRDGLHVIVLVGHGPLVCGKPRAILDVIGVSVVTMNTLFPNGVATTDFV